jgi:hypothetical protein
MVVLQEAHVSELAPNRSARIIGQDLGLTAVETNILLKEEGFLEGGPGAYAVTEKGKPYADEQHHHRGTGGYAQYNPHWDQITWDPSITDELAITNERRKQLQEAARAARQQKAEFNSAQAAAFVNGKKDNVETNDSGVDPLKAAVILIIAGASAWGIKKGAPHLKRLWTDKAAPSLKKLKNRTADDTRTQAETPDSDEDPST